MTVMTDSARMSDKEILRDRKSRSMIDPNYLAKALRVDMVWDGKNSGHEEGPSGEWMMNILNGKFLMEPRRVPGARTGCGLLLTGPKAYEDSVGTLIQVLTSDGGVRSQREGMRPTPWSKYDPDKLASVIPAPVVTDWSKESFDDAPLRSEYRRLFPDYGMRCPFFLLLTNLDQVVYTEWNTRQLASLLDQRLNNGYVTMFSTQSSITSLSLLVPPVLMDAILSNTIH